MSDYKVVKIQGGLGNQMFCLAFAIALSEKTNKKIFIDTSCFQGEYNREFGLDIFKIPFEVASQEQIKKVKLKKNLFNKIRRSIAKGHLGLDKLNIKTKIKIPSYYSHFAHYIFEYDKENYYEGLYQNEKYYFGVEDKIRQVFEFPACVKNPEFNLPMSDKIKQCENSVFIHIRRGDYLDEGWLLDYEYYKKAVDYMKEKLENPVFFVFSDEIEKVKQEFKIDEEHYFVDSINLSNADYEDMRLMSTCKHSIVSNSSFSWWAAWLNNNNKKIVIAPSPWVLGKDDIVCDSWVKIKA